MKPNLFHNYSPWPSLVVTNQSAAKTDASPRRSASAEEQRFTSEASRYQEHAAATHGPPGHLELRAPVSYESGSTQFCSTLSGSTLSDRSIFEVQTVGPETGVPATATNPADTLFNALPELNPALRMSKEWKEFEQDTHNLSLLANLVVLANPSLKPIVRHLVAEMVAEPTLAQRIFGVIQGGNASCGDRALLALHSAEEELLAQGVWNGTLDNNLPAVVNIARQVFRRTYIHRLAEEKVKAINAEIRAANLRDHTHLPEHTEEVETHLAYIVGLHESLQLGGHKPDAQFLGLSGVAPQDLEIAQKVVLDEEAVHFTSFLATWKPWQEVLRRRFPNDVAVIEEKLTKHRALIEKKLTEEAVKASVPLPIRQDGITRAIVQSDRDEGKKLWLGLTEHVLQTPLG
jgi:hypothetical protein